MQSIENDKKRRDIMMRCPLDYLENPGKDNGRRERRKLASELRKGDGGFGRVLEFLNHVKGTWKPTYLLLLPFLSSLINGGFSFTRIYSQENLKSTLLPSQTRNNTHHGKPLAWKKTRQTHWQKSFTTAKKAAKKRKLPLQRMSLILHHGKELGFDENYREQIRKSYEQMESW